MSAGFLRGQSYPQFSLLQSDTRIYRKVELLNGVIRKSWMCSSQGFSGSNGEPAEVSFAVQYLPNPALALAALPLLFLFTIIVGSCLQ